FVHFDAVDGHDYIVVPQAHLIEQFSFAAGPNFITDHAPILCRHHKADHVANISRLLHLSAAHARLNIGLRPSTHRWSVRLRRGTGDLGTVFAIKPKLFQVAVVVEYDFQRVDFGNLHAAGIIDWIADLVELLVIGATYDGPGEFR